MATYSLRRLSRPEILRRIAPDHLTAFLRPYRRALTSRGVALPAPGAAEPLDFLGLTRVFLSPDKIIPPDLIDALCLVDEMATPDGMTVLLEEAKNQGLRLTLDPDQSPADVAVQVLLGNRDILERKHAEQHFARVRSFESYQTEHDRKPTFETPAAKQLHSLEADLDKWFVDRNRGGGAKVIMDDRPDSIWFLVRHGESYKREESLEGHDASSVCYRPLKYDVLVYSPPVGELRVNARSKADTRFYRETFGRHFFNDEGMFLGVEKYTLDPLRELGEDSLSPGDIEGIDWIRLREVQLYFPGSPWEVVTRTSDDVFALFKTRGKPFPESGRIIRAKFQIKFTDAKTPRSVIIKPSNIAQFTRDDDSVVVESWLAARGFII